jgi:hypothetical protein
MPLENPPFKRGDIITCINDTLDQNEKVRLACIRVNEKYTVKEVFPSYGDDFWVVKINLLGNGYKTMCYRASRFIKKLTNRERIKWREEKKR